VAQYGAQCSFEHILILIKVAKESSSAARTEVTVYQQATLQHLQGLISNSTSLHSVLLGLGLGVAAEAATLMAITS